jgi:hypothetical protein
MFEKLSYEKFSHTNTQLSPSWKTWMKYLVHDGEGQMIVVMSFVLGSETFTLTFKNRVPYILDRHTATLQMLHFIYFFHQI